MRLELFWAKCAVTLKTAGCDTAAVAGQLLSNVFVVFVCRGHGCKRGRVT